MSPSTSPTLWRSRFDERLHEEERRSARETPVQHRRRLLVCALTLLLDGVVLRWSLGIPAGDPMFYGATVGLAAILLAGSQLAGRPLRPGVDEELARRGERILTGLGWGVVLLVTFLVGAAVVAQVPVLRDPVKSLLAHADQGSVLVVMLITMLNGVVEETFYRGALYDALGGRRAVTVTTIVYTAVTALAGIPLLALAALLLGLACALLRRWTRGVLAPIVCHLTWSVGMLFLLGPTLHLLEPR